MKIAGLFLLPFLAGYAFAVIWSGSRYFVARENGNRLYFRAGFYSLFMYASSFLVLFDVRLYFPKAFSAYIEVINFYINSGGHEIYDEFAIFRVSVAVFSVVFALVLAHSLNTLTVIKRRSIKTAIKNDDFEIMVERSMRKFIPLSVTLSSGKVYVGFSVRSHDPVGDRKDLRILPLLSGYRTEEMTLEITTNYRRIYELVESEDSTLKIGDFEIVIACREIQTCNLFDLVAYQVFQNEVEVERNSALVPIL